MTKKKISSIYSRSTRLKCDGSSRTKQSFKDEVDVNKIVKRFTRANGVSANSLQGFPLDGKYGDFSDVVDLRSMYERIQIAKDSFFMLPSTIRMKFMNDPISFLEFTADEANLDEMRELGLAKPKPIEAAPASPQEAPAD